MATKQDGFYCSTSGTYFSDKESLAEHYKSDFHRYNLKRKVAGLPPVTKDWFEARKAQLTSATSTSHQKIWLDPLTKKKFQTQNTYQAHVNSKKYQELVKQSGQPAPAPIIMMKQLQEEGASATNGAASRPAAAAAAGYTVKAPHPKAADNSEDECGEIAAEAEDSDSGWETASEDEDAPAAAAAAAAPAGNSRGFKQRQQQATADNDDEDEDEEAAVPEEDWVKWDVCVSLFDNKRSSSMQDNLEYMYKLFGFYLPDSEYLVDPEGLLQYLGAKLQYGKVPLYTAGDDPHAKQFRSLHAVQRHMVDTNQCKMLYDGNEEEYEDFYDYSKSNNAEPADDIESADSSGLALATSGVGNLDLGSGSTGWQLAVAGGAAGGKILGSRELAKYYRQRPKPFDSRQSVAVNSIVAQYRSLGVVTKAHEAPADVKRAQKEKQRQQRQWLNLAMRTNINNNLPKNVPY